MDDDVVQSLRSHLPTAAKMTIAHEVENVNEIARGCWIDPQRWAAEKAAAVAWVVELVETVDVDRLRAWTRHVADRLRVYMVEVRPR